MRAVLLSLALLAGATNCPAQPDPKPTTKCHEGDPCWDCKTMGNKRCGPSDKRHVQTKGAADERAIPRVPRLHD